MAPLLISVIIPVYNAERTLRECVDSVLQQDMKDFELILVDDGSKDASPVICDEYASKDNRVRVIHQQNAGVSAARNRGLDIAQGEWITFVDSDDSIGAHFFDEVANSTEKLLLQGYFMHDEHGEEVEQLMLDNVHPQPPLKDFINQYISYNLLRGPVAKFYKRSIIGDLRFLEDMKVGEDTYFVWLYLSKIKTYKILYSSYYNITTNVASDIKYQSSTNYSIASLQHLQKAFECLHNKQGISKSKFLSFIGYFKKISSTDWGECPSKWYRNKEVQSLYKYVWPDLSLLQKLRLIVTFIIMKK